MFCFFGLRFSSWDSIRQLSFHVFVGYWICRLCYMSALKVGWGVVASSRFDGSSRMPWFCFAVLFGLLHSEELSGLGSSIFSGLVALLGKDRLSRLVRLFFLSISFFLPPFIIWIGEVYHYLLGVGRRFPVQKFKLYAF